MKTANSRELVKQIMVLYAPVRATIESTAGFGATSNAQQAVLDLKEVTARFATETEKPKPDKAKIDDLTNQIEAGLRTLHALNIIDSKKLDSLLTILPK